MSYCVLFSLRQPLRNANAPVSVVSGTLFRDNASHRLLLQLALQNCAPQAVSAVHLRVTLFNAQGAALRTVDHQYSCLAAAPGAVFGAETSICIPDCDAASFTAEICRVVFCGAEAVFSSGGTSCAPIKPSSLCWLPLLLTGIALTLLYLTSYRSILRAPTSIFFRMQFIERLLLALVLPVLCCVFIQKGKPACKILSTVCFVIVGLQAAAAVLYFLCLLYQITSGAAGYLSLINGSNLLFFLAPPYSYFPIIAKLMMLVSNLSFFAKNIIAGVLLQKAAKEG